MIVASDNSALSALSALAEIGRLPLLPLLFGEVTIPEAVLRECLDPGAPEELRAWAGDPPDWLAVVADPDPLLPETDGLPSPAERPPRSPMTPSPPFTFYSA